MASPSSSTAASKVPRGPNAADQAPSLPTPSFTSLPDIAHATIASFLPDGDRRKDTRLRVSEVSRALLEAYGGSLTCVSFHTGTHSVARLAALLRRRTPRPDATLVWPLRWGHGASWGNGCPLLSVFAPACTGLRISCSGVA